MLRVHGVGRRFLADEQVTQVLVPCRLECHVDARLAQAVLPQIGWLLVDDATDREGAEAGRDARDRRVVCPRRDRCDDLPGAVGFFERRRIAGSRLDANLVDLVLLERREHLLLLRRGAFGRRFLPGDEIDVGAETDENDEKRNRGSETAHYRLRHHV